MTKDEIRAAARERRRLLLPGDIAERSSAIEERLMPLLGGANTVMCYLSAFKEPMTDGIISRLLHGGARVAVPVTDTGALTITPVYLTSLDAVTRGAYGIREPIERDIARIEDIDAAVIPGIAFDVRGARIGFGKGYYDRLLREFNGLKIGVCYDFQLYENIPHEQHDIAMDMIITEGRLINDI